MNIRYCSCSTEPQFNGTRQRNGTGQRMFTSQVYRCAGEVNTGQPRKLLQCEVDPNPFECNAL